MEIRHKRGDVREDGKVFWEYVRNVEYWISVDKFEPKKKKILEQYKARSASNKEKVALRMKEYRKTNKEKIADKRRIYFNANKDKISAQYKAYCAENSDKIVARSRAYYVANAKKINSYGTIYRRNRYKTDPVYRLTRSLRVRLQQAFKSQGVEKTESTFNLAGCTKEGLRQHLVSQFREGMTLENHGPIWHIDHIRPCASFDLSDKAQAAACFHYSNLQPLFAEENRMKSDKFQLV
jgi:hypothetical protein